MSSLRNKIILSFSLSNAAILIIAVIVFADLNYLQDQIVQGEQVKDFTHTISQLKNDENILLRDIQPEAYFRLNHQTDLIIEQLQSIHDVLDGVATDEEMQQLNSFIQRYSDLLDGLLEQSGVPLLRSKEDLRSTSQAIMLLSRDVGHRHHLLLGSTTRLASWTLVIALSLVVVMGGVSAFFVVRQVVKPVSKLEKQLDAVADGRAKKLEMISEDAEIQSFVQHFNSMLDNLRSQQRQLRHNEKAAAFGVLVSGVAHELNNPLSNISTSTQLLLEDDDTDPALRQQWLTHIDSETDRSRRIVRRLLDSVRQPTLKMQNISAAELVRASTLLIHRQLDPSILLDIEDIPEIPVHVDRERFQQVFINLIRNAVDAGASNVWVFGDVTTWEDSMPGDVEHVEGDMSTVSESDELLLFTIADDGPGIPDEYLPQLFTPFFTTKMGGEGTGLGLYLVEEIVDEHNGCITAENRKEGGSQFLIWLPAAKEEEET